MDKINKEILKAKEKYEGKFVKYAGSFYKCVGIVNFAGCLFCEIYDEPPTAHVDRVKLSSIESIATDEDIEKLFLQIAKTPTVELSPSQPYEQKPPEAKCPTCGKSVKSWGSSEPTFCSDSFHLSPEDGSKGAEETLEKYITNKSDSFDHFYKDDVLKAMQEYAQQSMKQERDRATLKAVQECFKIAESISFDTEDQTGFRFVAVNLDELREKLTK